MAGERWDGEWRSENDYRPRFVSVNPTAAFRSLLYLTHVPCQPGSPLSSFNAKLSRCALSTLSFRPFPSLSSVNVNIIRIFACSRSLCSLLAAALTHSVGIYFFPPYFFSLPERKQGATLLIKCELCFCRHVESKNRKSKCVFLKGLAPCRHLPGWLLADKTPSFYRCSLQEGVRERLCWRFNSKAAVIHTFNLDLSVSI